MKHSSPEPTPWLCQHLDFGPLVSRIMPCTVPGGGGGEALFLATQFVVLCHGSPRKLIQSICNFDKYSQVVLHGHLLCTLTSRVWR